MLLTKLIASLGPATRDKAMLQQLVNTGMNIARFNFSHADYDKTREIMDIIQTLDMPYGPVSILLDTKGPEIRTGDVEDPYRLTRMNNFSSR
jgi:pyruvate kinase